MSDRKARLMLSCATDGGDPAVADLVQNLGAEGAWAKIIEGALGEPAARRAAQVTANGFERLAEAAGARFVVPGDDEWPAGRARGLRLVSLIRRHVAAVGRPRSGDHLQQASTTRAG